MITGESFGASIRATRDPFISRLIAIASIAAFLITAWASSHSTAPDFRAFYCAGSVVAAKQDPYRIEPLRTCERGNGPKNFFLENGGVMPAPLPGYDLAAFALLSRLPYEHAKILWQTLLWVSVAVCILAVTQATGIPLAVSTAAFLFSLGYPASVTGNLASFACAGLALSMWCCSRRNYALAALCAAFAMCEPHVALGSCLALVIFVPAARLPIALCAAALGALTWMTGGAARMFEYARDILPRHALSEVAHEAQFSLTNLLHMAHASDNFAVAVGNISYLISLSLGVIVASRLRNRLRNDAVIIAVPAAFALIGGPFVHYVQLAAALPAALFLYMKLPKRRTLLRCAVFLLATPWIAASGLQEYLPFVLLSTALLSWSFTPNVRIAALAWLLQTATLLTAAAAFPTPIQPQTLHLSFVPSAFSEDAWRTVVETLFSRQAAFYTALKIPTWCGLLILAYVAVQTAFAKPAKTPAPSA